MLWVVENGVILQGFHYRQPSGGTHWRFLRNEARALAQSGFTALWLPPASKGAGGPHDVGYGAYDLFDLGEFSQKGTVATKYGTRAELEAAVEAIQDAGMQAYLDVVFNHKNGGDGTERVEACEVAADNRNHVYHCQPIEIWSRFTFPGRRDLHGSLQHSTMEWHADHFDSTDWDESRKEQKIYRLKSKQFETNVSIEKGNYDYLLGVDLDTSHHEVEGELRWWGRWIVDHLQVDGFRLDAVKHIRAGFMRDWINHLRAHFGGRELFTVGEFWSHRLDRLHWYLDLTEGAIRLFDVPLHQRLHRASLEGNHFDLRGIFDGTLVQSRPHQAVTFVDNHDTQPGESLESWVEPWFKPMAYALILLRQEGYPCVFYGDYFGDRYERHGGGEVTMHSHRYLIDRFLRARREYGFGDQHDYFDHPNTIGWTRLGDSAHPGSMAIVISNGSSGFKWMNMFRSQASYRDVTGHFPEERVFTQADGWARFPCRAGSVSVWVQD